MVCVLHWMVGDILHCHHASASSMVAEWENTSIIDFHFVILLLFRSCVCYHDLNSVQIKIYTAPQGCGLYGATPAYVFNAVSYLRLNNVTPSIWISQDISRIIRRLYEGDSLELSFWSEYFSQIGHVLRSVYCSGGESVVALGIPYFVAPLSLPMLYSTLYISLVDPWGAPPPYW